MYLEPSSLGQFYQKFLQPAKQFLKQTESTSPNKSPVKSFQYEHPQIQPECILIRKNQPSPVLMLTKLLTNDGLVFVKIVRNIKSVLDRIKSTGKFGLSIHHAKEAARVLQS